jgi:hypothetical protein
MLYADSMQTLRRLYATDADQLLTDSGIPRYDGSVDSDPFDTYAPQPHWGAMADEETTMNQDALLDLIHAGRSRWESALTQLSPDQMTAPALFDGWSVKDLVAHIGAWEQTAASVFAALLSGQAPDFEIDEIALDAFNARFFAEHHDQSLGEVLAGEQAAYRSFLSLVEGASEVDLFDPDRFAWMQGAPFAEWVGANTFEHYDEHLADMPARLEK